MSRVIGLRLAKLEQCRGIDHGLTSLSDAELVAVQRDCIEAILAQDPAPEASGLADTIRRHAKNYRLDPGGDLFELWPHVRAVMDKEAEGAAFSLERLERLIASLEREGALEVEP